MKIEQFLEENPWASIRADGVTVDHMALGEIDGIIVNDGEVTLRHGSGSFAHEIVYERFRAIRDILAFVGKPNTGRAGAATLAEVLNANIDFEPMDRLSFVQAVINAVSPPQAA
ncbi:hypothetical protein EUV02_03830 [Polymorphobacter arshaanensis]|uniref:Uncharacterized protein n=1 Tax=Glacieibacterium arshaanense TaxID=2511025 RepID=A0A4Y9ERS0_9SPHN|nr:hypothetical protein [Polymorphobacter arshaanensis]TFU06152.1 hypothetical protein EUV02_03830 [Polymorphobacter arshaanensis]